jgi:lambda repressor-like predicted transcriptional regulator
MTRKQIKIMLIEKDLSVAGLAREFGYFREELQMCIGRQRQYPKLREKLAARLGVSVETLFPEAEETANQSKGVGGRFGFGAVMGSYQ